MKPRFAVGDCLVSPDCFASEAVAGLEFVGGCCCFACMTDARRQSVIMVDTGENALRFVLGILLLAQLLINTSSFPFDLI
jgi:hypothetical protein